MSTSGYKELSAQLTAMGGAVGRKTLRASAMSAMLPALRAAQKAAPVGAPPYKGKDPYPVKTYKGRLRTPGFASRNVARKAKVSRDGTSVSIFLGVKPEAFYALQFHELGTSKIPKKPWLEPSFRQSLPLVDARFQSELKKRIDKAARTKLQSHWK